MLGSWRTRSTSPARRRSKGASRGRNTSSPPPAVARSSGTSITWRRSSAPHGSAERSMHKSRHSGAQSAHSTFIGPHVAVIMDGNGRWATAHGLSRSAGHEAGLRTARDIVEASVREGVGTLTLYAFSSDNWKRPTAEVTALMRLFRRALLGEAKRCLENGVRLTILGRRDRLPTSLRHTIEQVEKLTASGSRMHLRVAVDYSARDAMLRAAAAMRGDSISREGFTELLARVD